MIASSAVQIVSVSVAAIESSGAAVSSPPRTMRSATRIQRKHNVTAILTRNRQATWLSDRTYTSTASVTLVLRMALGFFAAADASLRGGLGCVSARYS